MIVLQGRHPSPMAAPIDSSDWLLIGVKVTQASNHDVWFVRLSAVSDSIANDGKSDIPRIKEFTVPFGLGPVKTSAKFLAPIAKLQVETFDEQGELLRSSMRTVPYSRCDATLLDVLRSDSVTDVRGESSLSNLAGMVTLLELTGGSRALLPIGERIREHVLDEPNLIDFLLSGLRLRLETPIEQHQLVCAAWPSETGLIFSQEAAFPVTLAGRKLFDCRLVVGPAVPPYDLLAGTLLIEAVNPEHGENRLKICVLAGRHVDRPDGSVSAAIVATNR